MRADELAARLDRLREGLERMEREVEELVAWLRRPRERVVRWQPVQSGKRNDAPESELKD